MCNLSSSPEKIPKKQKLVRKEKQRTELLLCDFFNYRVVFLFSTSLPSNSSLFESWEAAKKSSTSRMDQEYLIVLGEMKLLRCYLDFFWWEKKKIALSWLADRRRRGVREEIIRDEIIIGKRIGGWNRWSGGWLVVGVIKEAVNCRGLYNNHYFRSIWSLRFTCQPSTHSRAENSTHFSFRVQRQNDDRVERRVIYAKQQRRRQQRPGREEVDVRESSRDPWERQRESESH